MTLTQYASANFQLTKPQANLLVKLESLGVAVNIDKSRPLTVTNPITGYSEQLDPMIAVLCRWIYKVYATYGEDGAMSWMGNLIPIQVFDRVKYLVLALDSKAYSNFVD